VTAASDGDLDDDGLPDEWETQYFGGPTNANPSAMASNGVNTVKQAYVAGLDPTDSTNLFLISVFPLSAERVLQWQSASGRIYSVHSTSNLQENFHALETNILFPQSSYTDTVHRAEQFYKIDVELP